MLTVDKQIQCANNMVKSWNISDLPTILLCTDSVDIKKYAVAKYSNVYGSPIIPVHTDKVGDHINMLNSTLGTWVDLFMLAAVDGLILSKSGFSVLAGEIGMYHYTHRMSLQDCLHSLK